MPSASGPSRPSAASRDVAALILAAVCWGLGTVVSKVALEEFPPFTLLAAQLATSVVVLALLLRRQGVPLFGQVPPILGRLGVLNPGIAYALSLIGLASITASLAVLLWALEPILILVLAAVFLGERITRAFVALTGIALIGMVLVVYDPGAGASQLVGVALTVAGVACCAAYTVITRRFIPGADDTSQVVLSQQVHALAFTIPALVVVAALGFAVVPTTFSAVGLASALTSGILYYAAAYLLYLSALRRVQASLAASSFYLIPVVGLTAGGLLLGDRLEPYQWAGAVLVIGAVIGILRGSSSAAPIALATDADSRVAPLATHREGLAPD
jgi:drug/metabolite transporter (DMT)-like permease